MKRFLFPANLQNLYDENINFCRPAYVGRPFYAVKSEQWYSASVNVFRKPVRIESRMKKPWVFKIFAEEKENRKKRSICYIGEFVSMEGMYEHSGKF